ncbi:hypothetical protein OAN80_03680 [Alphaproteobacteria bacterium]|nr:hypothetical protein [Alphaproteobacteria bacterium]
MSGASLARSSQRGEYFDTILPAATSATSATDQANFIDMSQESQKSQAGERINLTAENIIDLRDAFEERAVIMELDGGMSQADAERAAAANTDLPPDSA